MGFVVPAEQVAIMFGLMALGWLAVRVGWLRGEAEKGLSNVLLNLVTPAVIVQSFQRPFNADQLREIGLVFVLDLAIFAVLIGAAQLGWNARLVPDAGRRAALRFGTVYSNAGFIGIPLARAIVGDDGVFYTAAFITAYNLLVWTHGISLFGATSATAGERVRRIVLNPGILATVVAVPLFAFSVVLPAPVATGLDYLSAMNTPLSMIVVGASLATISLRTVFSSRLIWAGALVRNLVVPLVLLGLLGLAPITAAARMSVLISVSAPVGAMLVILTIREGRDARFGTRLLCLSTLLSVVTLPAMLALAAGF